MNIMTKNITKINTKGDFSPGEVHGDYNQNYIVVESNNDKYTNNNNNANDTSIPDNIGSFRGLIESSKNDKYIELVIRHWEAITKGRVPTPYESAIIARNILTESLDEIEWSSRRALSYILGSSLSRIKENNKATRIIDEIEIISVSADQANGISVSGNSIAEGSVVQLKEK